MATATDDLNSTTIRTDIAGEVFPEGDLPSFSGGGRQTLPPGTDTFRLPLDLPTLWQDMTDANGVPSGHIKIKFDKDHPLVVIGGPNDGQPLTATFTSIARPRGKKGDTSAPVISDLSYFCDRLGDKTRPMSLGGQAGINALKAAINKYAGGTVSLNHGLTGQCRPDKVRYVFVDDTSTKSVPDPNNVHGCGKRHYTRDFTKPSYEEVIPCKGTLGDGSPCPAAIRGFESIDW